MSLSSGTSEHAMTVLGIDTAIRTTGYAVLRVPAPGKFEVLDCGVIRNSKELPHSECLRRLSGGIRQIVGTFHPDAASMESAFFHRNVRTAMILSLARGAVLASLAENGVCAYEYSPKTAKRAAVGRGDASKEQVASMIAAICGLDVSGIPDDATDALALALCHANASSRKELLPLLGTRI